MQWSCKQGTSTGRRIVVMAYLLALTICRDGSAHEGPPFPLLMDKPVGNHVVSVWADPDIGEARFFIVVERPSGDLAADDLMVSMWVEPAGRRLERAVYQAERSSLRNQVQFEVRPYFDQRDMWTIGIGVSAAGGITDELITQVESTPPGFGPWDLAIYLFPFLLFGGMWAVAMVRRSRMGHHIPDDADSAASDLTRRSANHV